VDRTWDQDRKIWPTITVDADWKSGMSGGPVFNENGDVVGIVSRGVDSGDESQPWSSALWLEPLPFREDIYGSIDPRYPGRIVGWGACNAHSAIELFQTREAAEDYVRNAGLPLHVKKVSASYRTLFTRPDNLGWGRRKP
jgi:serine protease Do